MIVSQLKVDGFLGLKAIELKNLDMTVKLLGKNGAGKSRIILAILAALKYDSLPKDKREEILKGDGFIEAELTGVETSKWIVRREIKDGKNVLSVKGLNGVKGNQSTINQFIGDNFVDIGKFLELPKEAKEKAVLNVLGLSEPLSELEKRYKIVYESRRDIGRDRDSIGFNPEAVEPEKVDPVSPVDLMNQLRSINENNQFIENSKKEISDNLKNIADIEDQIAKLQSKLSFFKDRNDVIEKDLAGMMFVDPAPISDKINQVQEINRKAQEYKLYSEKASKYAAKNKEYDEKTEELETIKTEKQVLIKSKKFPVDGLSYGDDGLTYNGHPLISDGEYRKIAFMLAKALKGDLSIATFENFSLLDPDSREQVLKEAHEAGFQVFAEIVTGSNPSEAGFYIEDGELKKTI